MSRLEEESADIYEDHGSERKKKRPHAAVRVLGFFVFFVFFWGQSGQLWHQTVPKVQSLGRPLSGASQDFVDDVQLVYLHYVVLAFAKIYLHIFLFYIDNIKNEKYTENRCGDWDIFHRLC